MKITLTFANLTMEQAESFMVVARENALLYEPGDPKPKRPRRTKRQIADDAFAEKEAHIAAQEPEPAATESAPRRRKQRDGAADTGPEVAEANIGRGRKKRGQGAADPTPASPAGRKKRPKAGTSTTRSPSDEDISDEDASRKASEGAQALTPKVIVDLLGEFGVDTVNQLSQEQRREFADKIDEQIEKAQ